MDKDVLTVAEGQETLAFRFADLLLYHGTGFPGGVAHAFKAMQAAFPLLDEAPLQRREITVLTAFAGLGGRDAVEMVTRALTDGRMSVDRSLGGRDVLSEPPGPYLWRFTYRGRTVEVTIRPGHVREEFVRLGATPDRTPEQETRLTELKQEMATRLLALAATEIYEARLV
ncbi:hypothetical protein [Pannonibacter carbonis]|uniref:hypothetical protein n=1 Tax=Pannonibacter carbonis TaxID=2067569 RepID=UPI000D114DA6|nr:hypothetical protein [Pannonibacter carbonis]